MQTRRLRVQSSSELKLRWFVSQNVRLQLLQSGLALRKEDRGGKECEEEKEEDKTVEGHGRRRTRKKRVEEEGERGEGGWSQITKLCALCTCVCLYVYVCVLLRTNDVCSRWMVIVNVSPRFL